MSNKLALIRALPEAVCLSDDLIGELLRSGSLPGLLMVLSAEDRSTLTAPELLLSSMGLEDLFFIILMGVAGCCPCPPPKNSK